MTRNVLFYARYSTDRQNEVSIETQIELGREFVAEKGWKLVEVFTDYAISGTSYKSRPGIQSLLQRVAQGNIDIVLCITVDRISRDAEHGNGFLKRIRFQDAELWTVHGATPVTDIEMGLRATLSQELIEQIRYRTREGMKTAVRKGKAATCLAYGYRLKLAYDANGDRIPGLRDVDDEAAGIVRRIFELYADGVSPKQIARQLNDEGIQGPRGDKWRAGTIRGHVDRGAGILNNETYIGRVIWNRRNYRKNPETEQRVARRNDASEWVVKEMPDLRIVSEKLWARVKQRQKDVGEQFAHTKTNSLNAAHRPKYLLSGIIECAECGGPYATMAKDRYGCTNRKNAVPIDALDGRRCSNSKTILRRDIEDRVLACLPAAFLHMGIFDRIVADVRQKQAARLKTQPDTTARLRSELKRVEQNQANIIQQISDRASEGRPRLAALDDQLDQLEARRSALADELAATPECTHTMEDRLAAMRDEVNPETVQQIIQTALFYMRDKADTAAKQPFVNIVRQLVQKVVLAKTPGREPAALEVHGRIASILAAMDATTILEERFKLLKSHDYLARLEAGELDTEGKQSELLDAYAEELAAKRLEWADIQVSVVAGARCHLHRTCITVCLDGM